MLGMKDTHGSQIREMMRRSMAEPAGFHKLNRREPQMVRMSILIIFAVAVISAGFASFVLLDKIESHFRTVGIYER